MGYKAFKVSSIEWNWLCIFICIIGGMIMIWNENAQSIDLYDVIICVIFYVIFDFV